MVRALLCGATVCLALTACASSGLKMELPGEYEELVATAQADSNDAVAHYNAALAHWSKRDWEAVERELREAIAIEPQYADAYFALAFLPHAQLEELIDRERETGDPTLISGKMADAELAYRRAVMIDPLVNRRLIAGIGGKACVPGTVIWVGNNAHIIGYCSETDRTIDVFLEGKYQEAYDRFNEVQREAGERNARLPDAFYWYRGLASAYLGRYGESLNDLSALLVRAERREQVDSTMFEPLATNELRYSMAYVEYLSGQYPRAAQLFNEVLEYDLGLYMAHVWRAEMLERTRSWYDAAYERRKALELDPENTSLMRDLAITLWRSQRAEEAAEVLFEAVELNPRDPWLSYYLGHALDRLDRPDEAREQWQRFVAIAPSGMAEEVAEVRARLGATP